MNISPVNLEKIKRLHWMYGHFLIMIHMGLVTDERAKEERFDEMEKKFRNLLGGSGIEVEFDRELIPPKEITEATEYKSGMMANSHRTWYPLKFWEQGDGIGLDRTEEFVDQNVVLADGGIIGKGEKRH